MSIITDSHIAVNFVQSMANMSERRERYKLSPIVSLNSIIAQVQANRSIERAPSTVIRSVMHAVPAGLLRVQAKQDLEKLTEVYHKRYVLAPNDARLNEIMFVLPKAHEILNAAEVSSYTKRTVSGVRDTQRYLAREAKRKEAAAAATVAPLTPKAPLLGAAQVVASSAEASLATGVLDGAFAHEISAICRKYGVTKIELQFHYEGRPNQVSIQGEFTQQINGAIIVSPSGS